MRFSRGRGRSKQDTAPEAAKPGGKSRPTVSNRAVLKGLASPGAELAPAVRMRMESHFGAGLAGVRVHQGPDATASARELNAEAFAVGRDIVLGGGVRPHDSDPTMRHEVAHSVQQGVRRVSNPESLPVTTPGSAAETAAARGGAQPALAPAIARQPAKGGRIAPPATPPFKELFRQFRDEPSIAAQRPLAVKALDALHDLADEVSPEAFQLANFFLNQGMEAEARRALDRIQTGWMVKHVSINDRVPLTQEPRMLIERAREAARGDKHKLAFDLFGIAFQLLEFQAEAEGIRREEEAAKDEAKYSLDVTRGGGLDTVKTIGRTFGFYRTVKQIYDDMRGIFSFYLQLEAEARKAGNVKKADELAWLGLLLYVEIQSKYVWSGPPGKRSREDQNTSGDILPVAEVELVTKGNRDALRMYGENLKDLDLTALPGLKPPREVTPTGKAGSVTYQSQEAGALAEALFGQAAILWKLKQNPGVQKAFGNSEIDMQSLKDRLRIWGILYADAQKEGRPNPLAELMEFIGLYLKAFTLHTMYNVADFGKSYLADNEGTMPSDLAGRLERDCGVYALTVAYEVFRTARDASPRLPVEFVLYALPDHAALVIKDTSTGEHYVVNNDQIVGPKKGDPDRDVGNLYQALPGVKNLITPAFVLTLGTTKMKDDEFQKKAWEQYQDATSWTLHVDPKPGQAVGDAVTETYENFYEGQKQFDKDVSLLGRAVDTVQRELATAGSAGPLPVARKLREPFRALSFRVAKAFFTLGPGAEVDTSRPDPKLQQRLKDEHAKHFLFTSEKPNIAHPLARAAMVLLFFQNIGLSLTAEEQAIIDLADKAGFAAALADYRAAGFPAKF